MKTVRFAEVVQRSGRPHVHALWVEPDHDPELIRARKANRVMTIDTPAYGKADVGTIGFLVHHRPGTQFLVFPRSLSAFAGARVVGIKFDLVDQPANVPAKPHEGWIRPAHSDKRPAPVRDRSPLPPRTAASGPEETESPERESATARDQHQAPSSPAAPPPHTRPATKRRAEAPYRRAAKANAEPPWVRQVGAALAELHDGRTVAAYQRLERLLADHFPRALDGTR